MSCSIAKTCFDAIRAKQSAVAAGYDPMVVENQDVYEGLLLRAVDSSTAIIESSEDDKDSSVKSLKPKTRRQTPLVNAGYAARVLSVSNAIRSFVAYHELVSSFRKQQQQQQGISTPKHNIRIVFLGCGVDVIGLWSRSLLSDNNENLSMTIVEVDTPEVCSIKRKMLIHQDMVRHLEERECARDNPASNKPVTLSYHTGTIVLPSSSSLSTVEEDSGQSSCDYVLIPGDLNDTFTLEPILESSRNSNGNNPETEYLPTLVVSELVLSYVPPSGTDRLLHWCSRKLCRTPDSAMVSLEPLGSPLSTAEDATISVEKGYQTDYNQKFQDKMEKGRSKTQQRPCFFHPIGNSPESIIDRWSKAGFCPKTSSSVNLGTLSMFAASKQKRTFVCPELFDEHAGWILHLRSYTLVCGLIDPASAHCSSNNNSCCDPWLFRRMLCPWRHRADLALVRSGLPLVQKESRIVFTEIDICDEDSVRGLFQSTYGKGYTEKYPAIRKLIKGVLNKDLRKTEEPTPTPDSSDDTHTHTESPAVFDSRSSTIGDFYRSSGGIFLVAIQYTDVLGGNDAVSCLQRQVVGCAGIRSSEGKKNPNNDTTSLEIFRLAVDVHHRGKGIGRGLLQALEGFAREEQQRRGTALRFVANTLTILEAAGRLYKSCGYQLREETPLGNSQLVLSTYVKKNRNEIE